MGTETLPPDPGDWIPEGNALDFSHTGIIWVDRAIDAGVILALIAGVIVVAWRLKIKPMLDEITAKLSRTEAAASAAQENAAVTREHTENSHGSAKNPNLRDDLDAKHAQTHQELANLAKMLARMEHTQTRTDKELARINDTLVDDRKTVHHMDAKLDAHIEQKAGFERRITAVEAKLDEHRDITEP